MKDWRALVYTSSGIELLKSEIGSRLSSSTTLDSAHKQSSTILRFYEDNAMRQPWKADGRSIIGSTWLPKSYSRIPLVVEVERIPHKDAVRRRALS